jgi:hypothetical protein
MKDEMYSRVERGNSSRVGAHPRLPGANTAHSRRAGRVSQHIHDGRGDVLIGQSSFYDATSLARAKKVSMRRRGKTSSSWKRSCGGAVSERVRDGSASRCGAAGPTDRARHTALVGLCTSRLARVKRSLAARREIFAFLRQSLAASHKGAFRVVHFSVQTPRGDPRGSGSWFEGSRHGEHTSRDASPCPTDLATIGWRRAGGPIALDEQPVRARVRGTRAPKIARQAAPECDDGALRARTDVRSDRRVHSSTGGCAGDGQGPCCNGMSFELSNLRPLDEVLLCGVISGLSWLCPR